jgi:hypothetical protein
MNSDYGYITWRQSNHRIQHLTHAYTALCGTLRPEEKDQVALFLGCRVEDAIMNAAREASDREGGHTALRGDTRGPLEERIPFTRDPASLLYR